MTSGYPVPPESWCFARFEGGTGLYNQGAVHAVIPSDSHIHIPGGFEPSWIYELVYTGRDPLVVGLGHAAVRDFVYRGFNSDAAWRKIFDGILPHVAGAGRMWLNHRFANADVSGGHKYEDHFNPADTSPLSYAETSDHLTGRRDAILKRPETDPLVIHTQTSTEYCQRARVACPHRHAGQRSAAAGRGADLHVGEFATFCRPAAEETRARDLPELP
jgi:hypothetical protein